MTSYQSKTACKDLFWLMVSDSLVLRHFYCWFGAHGKAKHHSGSTWQHNAAFSPRTRKPRQKEERTRVLIFFPGVHVSWPDFLSPDSISMKSPPSLNPWAQALTQGFWEIFQIQMTATSLWPWAWNLAIWVQCFLSCKVREIVLTSKETAQAQHTRYDAEVPLLFPHRREWKWAAVCGHNGCSIPTALHLPGMLKCCFHPKSRPSLPSAVKGATVDRFFPQWLLCSEAQSPRPLLAVSLELEPQTQSFPVTAESSGCKNGHVQ